MGLTDAEVLKESEGWSDGFVDEDGMDEIDGWLEGKSEGESEAE